MPKNKKLDDSSSSSDSDSSGPNDRNPPPKKAKTEAASKSSSSGGGGGGETSWQLDKKRQVRINEFRGQIYVDIREFYEDKSGDLKPGKKGISLSATQYQKFKQLIPDIDEALKKH